MARVKPISEQRLFPNSFGMCRSRPSFSNSRVFCTWKIASHLHIPQPLKTASLQGLARKWSLTPALCADTKGRGRGPALRSLGVGGAISIVQKRAYGLSLPRARSNACELSTLNFRLSTAQRSRVLARRSSPFRISSLRKSNSATHLQSQACANHRGRGVDIGLQEQSCGWFRTSLTDQTGRIPDSLDQGTHSERSAGMPR